MTTATPPRSKNGRPPWPAVWEEIKALHPVELSDCELLPNDEGWLTIHCPLHHDESPSLRVNIIDGGTRCMSRRCDVGNLNHLLDHFTETAKQPPAYRYGSKKPVPRGEWKETGWYEYDDEHGELVYRVVHKEDGHGNKTFDYQRPVGEKGWKTGGTKDIPRVLYRLPELIAADPDDHVFVVEGERLVKRLQKLGLVATTNPGGAGKWRDEHNEYLRGRRVVLLPDNDSPGRDHMEDVARALYGVAKWIKIAVLPDLADKGDIIDYLDDGGTVKRLEKLVEAAPLWRPPYAATWASDIVAEDVRWLWRRRIPVGKFTLVAGDPGVGKSMITCDLVARVSPARPGPIRTVILTTLILTPMYDAAAPLSCPVRMAQPIPFCHGSRRKGPT